MKKLILMLGVLTLLFSFGGPVAHAQTQTTLTAFQTLADCSRTNQITVCSNFPMVDTNGVYFWISYNTTAGTFDVTEPMSTYPYSIVPVLHATDFQATLTPIDTFTVFGYRGAYTVTTYTAVDGTFTGGEAHLILKEVASYFTGLGCSGHAGGCRRGWTYQVNIVNDVVGPNGAPIANDGPSTVTYTIN